MNLTSLDLAPCEIERREQPPTLGLTNLPEERDALDVP